MTAPNRGWPLLRQSHLNTNQPKKDKELTMMCLNCHKEVPTSLFTIHQESHFNENRNKAVQCEYCDEKFSNFFYRTKHVQTAHLTSARQCWTCGLRLETTQEAVRHMAVGFCKPLPYACYVCARRFPTEKEGFEHQKIHEHHSSQMVVKKGEIPMTSLKRKCPPPVVIRETKVAMQQVTEALAKAKGQEETKQRLENELRKLKSPAPMEGDFSNFEIVDMDSIPDLDDNRDSTAGSSSVSDDRTESETAESVRAGNQLASTISAERPMSTPKISPDLIRSLTPTTDMILSEGSRDRVDPVGALKLLVSSATESLLHTEGFRSDSGPVGSKQAVTSDSVMTDSFVVTSNDATSEKSKYNTQARRITSKDTVTLVGSKETKTNITPAISVNPSLGFKIAKNSDRKDYLRGVIRVPNASTVLKSPTTLKITGTAKPSLEAVPKLSTVTSSTEEISLPSKVRIVSAMPKKFVNEKSPRNFKDHDVVDSGANAEESRESSIHNLRIIGRHAGGYSAGIARSQSTKRDSNIADNPGEVGQVFARTLGNGRILYTTRKQHPVQKPGTSKASSSVEPTVIFSSGSGKSRSTVTATNLASEKTRTLVVNGQSNALAGELQKKVTILIRPTENDTSSAENNYVPLTVVEYGDKRGNNPRTQSCLTPAAREGKLKSFSLQPVYSQEAGSSSRTTGVETTASIYAADCQKKILKRKIMESLKERNPTPQKVENEGFQRALERIANLRRNYPNLAEEKCVRNTLLLLKQKLMAEKFEERKWRARMKQDSQSEVERWIKESEETQRQINLIKNMIRPDTASKKSASYQVTEDPDTKVKILKPVVEPFRRVPPEPELDGWKTTKQPAKYQQLPILAKRNVAIFSRDQKRKAPPRVEPQKKSLKKTTVVQNNINLETDDLHAVMNELAVRFPEKKSRILECIEKKSRFKESKKRYRRGKRSKLPEEEEESSASAATIATAKGIISVVSIDDKSQKSNPADQLEKESVYNYDPKTRNYFLTSEGQKQVVTESWDMADMNDIEIKEELPWDLACVKIEEVENEDDDNMIDAMDLGEYVDSVMLAERETLIQTGD